jgi:Ca2+-binding EF-hand superfamily protein
MKAFLRQFCECEISVEHVRQRIINKLQVSPLEAFQTLDRQQKGYFDLDDLREFIKQ